jgi:hypothetical protein
MTDVDKMRAERLDRAVREAEEWLFTGTDKMRAERLDRLIGAKAMEATDAEQRVDRLMRIWRTLDTAELWLLRVVAVLTVLHMAGEHWHWWTP